MRHVFVAGRRDAGPYEDYFFAFRLVGADFYFRPNGMSIWNAPLQKGGRSLIAPTGGVAGRRGAVPYEVAHTH